MTKIIGLTGGIGSGKSTVAKIFEEFGIPVFIADDQAKIIMKDQKIIEEIRNIFGNAIFDKEILNRKKLAEIVFNNADKLAKLNSVIHPAVRINFDEWVIKNKIQPYVLYETAILFESGRYKECDIIISVIAPEEVRINRVIERDKTTREHVLSRIKMQWSDKERLAKSDFIINNESLKIARHEVLKILKILNIKQNQS